MASKQSNDKPIERLDFLSEILLEGQELEIHFSSRARTNFKINGTLTIKEQDLLVKPKLGIINSPKAQSWMCTHPKYWKILCGLEQADTRHIKKQVDIL